VCGTASFFAIPDAGFSYQVEVASQGAILGCGVEGAAVTFLVEGKQAAETAVWHSGVFQHLTLIAGPPFAMFTGTFSINRELTSENLTGFVGTTACGTYGEWIGGGPVYSYVIEVFSNQLPGCGTEGAPVTFKILTQGGAIIATANETGTWHIWNDDLTPAQSLNLTFGPAGRITMPGTGGGASPGSSGGLPVALGLAGLAGAALGLALRRQA
jgi:hypothetical protein